MIDKLINIDPYIAVGLFLFIGGLLLFVFNTRAMILASASKNWDVAKGIILQSELYISDTDDSNSYKAHIKYSYPINENEYKSNRVYFGSNILSSFKKHRSQQLTLKYSKGRLVDVYYNRMNAKLSVLEPGIKSEILTGFILGIVFLIVGYIFYSMPEYMSTIFH